MKSQLWLSVAIAGASLTLAAAQDAQPERGEQILHGGCLSCHDLRPIETRALDEAGWSKEVASMIEKGAVVNADDAPVLVEYLVKRHGPLPDGPGKDILLNVCTRCHDLERVRKRRAAAAGWGETLAAMLGEGAPLTDEEIPVLLRYLVRNFSPEQ